MFFNEKLTFKEKPTMAIKEIQEQVDWVNHMDIEAMKTMMKTSGDLFVGKVHICIAYKTYTVEN